MPPKFGKELEEKHDFIKKKGEEILWETFRN